MLWRGAEGLLQKLQAFLFVNRMMGVHAQVGQFEGIIQHCLSTPGVHVIDLPINYAVSAQLQVRTPWLNVLALQSFSESRQLWGVALYVLLLCLHVLLTGQVRATRPCAMH